MAPPKSLPSIVLVHGSWHVPEHYSRFVDRLHHAGFEVFCPLLPSCDATKHDIADLNVDAAAVRDIVQPLIDNSKDVVMVLHSSGGAVGTEAMKGLSRQERDADGLQNGGAVIHLIYMCGFMLQVGGSVATASLPRPVPEPIQVYEDGTSLPRVSPTQLFYADVEPEYAKQMEKLLVPHCGRGRPMPITHPAWKYIPTTYLRTEDDQVLFLYWQDEQIQAVRDAGTELVVKSYKSSHSPFISMPDEMVKAIQETIS